MASQAEPNKPSLPSHLIPVAAASQHLAADPQPLTDDEKLALSLRIGSLVDEYDPARPNVYDEIFRSMRKSQKEVAKVRPETEALSRDLGGDVPMEMVGPASVTSPSPFAVNMLRRMGWHDGSGLGREHQGISTPLVAEAYSGQGVIVQARPVNLAPMVMKPTERKVTVPTRTVCLLNLLAAAEIDDSLEDEISDEAEKFGNLVSVRVEVQDGIVRVMCEYETIEDAKKALSHFNGRFFGGNVISAEFV